jgi:hypothetical protein
LNHLFAATGYPLSQLDGSCSQYWAPSGNAYNAKFRLESEARDYI